MSLEKNAKLRELAELTGEKFQDQEETQEEIQDSKKEFKPKKEKEISTVEGFRIIEKNDMPFGASLYPESWEFAYRCPTTEEVANFSTVEDRDYAKQISVMGDLVAKCYTIWNTENDTTVDSGEINDGERLFHFLKLREFYLHDNPITYDVFNQEKMGTVIVNLYAESLIFTPLKEALLKNYDGRKFSVSVKDREEKIVFLCPTFNTSKRVMKYITEKRKKVQEKGSKIAKEKEIDKTFILFLPYLFETGKETFERLEIKFANIKKDKPLFDKYMEIINRLQLSNQENISYEYNDESYETEMQFPSFRGMFINTISNESDEESEF